MTTSLIQFTLQDFARMFAAPVAELPDACCKLVESQPWFLYDIDQEVQLAKVADDLKHPWQEAGTRESKRRWTKRWSAVYRSVLKNPTDLNLLTPDYLKQSRTLRVNQRYMKSLATDHFEQRWWEVCRAFIIETWLKNYSHIYEFGCGTGHNLAAMARMYPNKDYVGLDYAPRVADLLDLVGLSNHWNLHGMVFDYFEVPSLLVPPGSAILTAGSLEQTGDRWRPFMEQVLRWEPGIVVHCEPFVEWYDPNLKIDQLAIEFHHKRHYLRGLPKWVTEHQDRGLLHVAWAHRHCFGSQYIEGYSLLVWKPFYKAWI